ncbi:MAG: CoA-binding protein [Pseudomonadota bacterium]
MRSVLTSVKTVAIIGASANNVRPSFFVAQYLATKGYETYPINPGQAGKPIAGAMTYASLAEVPVAVDMVDVFRRADALPGIVGEIMALDVLPKVVWLQLGIRDDAIAEALEMAGITVIQDRCPKIEYARLCGEIGWTGFNRRTISSKKPQLAKGFQHYSLGGK